MLPADGNLSGSTLRSDVFVDAQYFVLDSSFEIENNWGGFFEFNLWLNESFVLWNFIDFRWPLFLCGSTSCFDSTMPRWMSNWKLAGGLSNQSTFSLRATNTVVRPPAPQRPQKPNKRNLATYTFQLCWKCTNVIHSCQFYGFPSGS